MQVIVKGRHTSIPDELKELAVQKIQKVERFFDRIQTVEIEFSEEHNPRVARKHTVEVTLTTKAHLIRASATGPDPTSAVDSVVDKLQAQVKRLKGKITRRGSRSIRTDGLAGRKPKSGDDSVESVGNPNSDRREDQEGWPRLTRTARFGVKPMTPEEAILQMESLGHEFLPFVNAENESVGVVYRRKDGTFGLIEPS